MKWLLNVSTLDARDGGPAEAVLNIAGELAAHGEEVHVLAFTHPRRPVNARLEGVRAGGVRLHLIRKRRLGRLRPTVRQVLAAAWWGRDADVVTMHSFYQFTAIAAWVAHRLNRGSQLWCMPHGVFDAYQEATSVPAKSWYRRVVGGRVLSDVDMFVVASEPERQSVAEAVGTHAPVVVTGLGTFMPSRLPTSRPDVGDRTKSVLFLSRVVPKKRLDLLLEAFSILADDRPDLQLRICGATDGTYATQLKRTWCDLTNVVWVGRVAGEAKTREFYAASLFCLPSESENFGQAVTEAMAHGVPVITTTQVGASQFVTAAQAGWILEAPVARDLADAIRLRIDQGDLEQVGRNGAHYAARHLSWSAVADRWVETASRT